LEVDWKGGLHGIELFNIRGNEIGDEGAKVLSNAFQYSSTIRIIDLSYNNIGNVGKEQETTSI
jgi:hypothetical protein